MPPSPDSVDASHVHDDSMTLRSSRKPRRTGIWALLALVLLVNLAASLYQLPVSRVIERRLCHEHYAVTDPSVIDKDGNVAEGLCKVDDVQQGLAWIQGTMETAWIVGGKRAESHRRALALRLTPIQTSS